MVTNLQKVRYLTYNSFKFKDSLEHLPTSLSKLVNEINNPYQQHKFTIFNQSRIIKRFLWKHESNEVIGQKIKFLTGGKGTYPYTLCNDSHIMKNKIKS